MRIAKIEAIPLEASFARAFGGQDKVPPEVLRPAAQFQKIVRAGQYSTLVIVTADDGARGVGEAFGLPHPTAAAALIEKVVAPALIDTPITEPRAMLEELYRYFPAIGHTRGPALEALSGVDIALWDLMARARDLPLCRLLGGEPGLVPVYVSPIPFLPSVEASAAAARRLIDAGFVAVKLKIGRGMATDLAHIEATRDAIGPTAQLMLDCNCAYDEATAIELGRQLHHHGVTWNEEPIPPGDPASLARVRAGSSVPIAAGENDFQLADFRALIAADAVDVLMPNITRAGGVSGLMAIGEACAAGKVGLSPHGVGGAVAVATALHLCRAAPGFRIYEANRLPNPLRDTLSAHRFEPVAGSFAPPQGPGHGIELLADQIATWRVPLHIGTPGTRS